MLKKTWSLREEDIKKLIVFENNCHRPIAGVVLIQRVWLHTIRAHLDITDTIIQLIQPKRLNWFGHALRRDSQKSNVYLSHKSEFQNRRPTRRTHCAGKTKSRKILACPCSQLKDMRKTKPARKIVGTEV